MNKPTEAADSISEGVEHSTRCPQCGAAIRFDHGTCVNCFLREGLEAKGEASRETFESILVEEDIPDKEWRLGHYEILGEIGRGGMGVIYRARQRHSRRIVAVKRVLAHQVNSHETLVRFRREAEAVASLDHPNILPIYEVSESDEGLPFFSMKYATGGSLRTAAPTLRAKPRECVRLMAKVARAIAYAHDKAVIHRDLQPGNILLDENGEPMVSDFGLAKWLNETSDLTRTLETLGTPGYIAPEQADCRPADVTNAADIYSLGAILFYLLTGRPPFVGPNVLSVIHQAAATPAPRLRSLLPSLERDLETIVARCLESDPKARYQSAAALADDLEHWLRHEPIRARRTGVFTRGRKWVRRNPTSTVLVGSLIVLAATMAVILWDKRSPPTPVANVAAVPSKSIAVLPFEDLGADPESASFTDGVHDEILNDLAKIAGLKVIGRTSVMQHKARPTRDLRQIASELGVTHVVEGSVQRAANRVRISAQLINAKNGHSIWSRNYDRTLADSVTLAGDLATEIATAVGATLGPQLKALVTAKPTNNAGAYDAYLSGRVFASEDQTDSALRSYQKAVELDPNFALAWAGLSSMQSLAHWELDSSPERVSTAKAAMDRALTLDPNLPEGHLALGYYRYYVLRDFTGALAELREAEQALPSDTDVIKTIAMVQRRLGQWDEALAGFLRVVELDPRDMDGYGNLALTYEAKRRFSEALTTFDRALSWEPMKIDSEAKWKSLVGSNGAWKSLLLMKADALWATGDLQASKLPYESAYTIAFMRAGPALLQHSYAEAQDILSQALADKSVATYSADVFEDREILLLMLGLTQQRAGDIVVARVTYQQVVKDARHTLDTVSPGSPAEAQARVNLAWAYAGLGESDSAIEEGRKAMAIMPSSKDSYRGPKYEENIARIYALLGDADHAIPILKRLLETPYLAPLTSAKLRTDPTLDQIRNDPRFQELADEGKPIPEKSIAVLPFDNLSADPENAYFAGGIQEEILTRLASVADLKVISRTSTQRYHSKPNNLGEIAKQLGVANILEGSVQKAADQVRVNVQLIKAQTDSHLWAETYDRKLTDIFGVESEIAKQIAESLQAKITGREEQALAVKPTNNPEAYDAYLRALALVHFESDYEALERALQTLKQAVELDPNFAAAWALLARIQAQAYSWGSEHTEVDRTTATRALETALRLQPELAEVQMAQGYYQYYILRDWNAARQTFERLGKRWPNNADIVATLGLIAEYQGRWKEALKYHDDAIALSPRDLDLRLQACLVRYYMHDFTETLRMLDQVLNIWPANTNAILQKVQVYQALGQLDHAQALLSGVQAEDLLTKGGGVGGFGAMRIRDQALLSRDPAAIARALTFFRKHTDPPNSLLPLVHAYGCAWLGRLEQLSGQANEARAHFTEARKEFEQQLKEQEHQSLLQGLVGALAGLGEREAALREADLLVERIPSSSDAINGPWCEEYRARTQARFGDADRAIPTLKRLLKTTYGEVITPALLRLHPDFDPLRDDPRFQELCEEKTAIP